MCIVTLVRIVCPSFDSISTRSGHVLPLAPLAQHKLLQRPNLKRFGLFFVSCIGVEPAQADTEILEVLRRAVELFWMMSRVSEEERLDFQCVAWLAYQNAFKMST